MTLCICISLPDCAATHMRPWRWLLQARLDVEGISLDPSPDPPNLTHDLARPVPKPVILLRLTMALTG